MSHHHHRADTGLHNLWLRVPKRISSFQGCPLRYPLLSPGPEAYFLGPGSICRCDLGFFSFSLCLSEQSHQGGTGGLERWLCLSWGLLDGHGERESERLQAGPAGGGGRACQPTVTFGAPESEGKRKPGFAALGSGLPEGGAPVLCFPRGARTSAGSAKALASPPMEEGQSWPHQRTLIMVLPLASGL